jgi:N-methylhydantoinase A/oxoprolinase/acetone carboxylase beta subunit
VTKGRGGASIRIAVDVGGTFTDLQVLDARKGTITSLKILTTPEDPSIGLMKGIKEAARRDGFALEDIRYLLHGTTIATNAVLEHKLPEGALVTTAGFEDVLEIGRHHRREVYTLNPKVPPVLIPRDRRLGVVERIRGDGTVAVSLTERAADELLRRVDQLGVAAVAVCFLNSYLNAEHEMRVAERLSQAIPSLKISCSSDLSPEIREYERTSTTVLNALLMPVVAGYIDKLTHRMEAEGFAPHLLLVQSNGGVCSARTAAREPVRLLLSGPSGGSSASMRIGRMLGIENLVGIDMGGTSFDVSVIREGMVSLIMQGEVDLMPVRLPMVEIRTIGAGGGSLAKVVPGGRLMVGPESAGARPGPSCYGHGGNEPTVTDANVALGRLGAQSFLGGEMPLDVAAARRSIDTRVAAPLGLPIEAAADGVLAVTNGNLGAAIRLSLFEKGLDPRDFVLLAFGGASGLHAVAVADELGIGRVVFPVNAATLSAFGILHTDLKQDLVRSRVLAAARGTLAMLAASVAELLAEARARLDADEVQEDDRVVGLAADMRYKGQAFELTVPMLSTVLDEATLDQLVADFHALHRQRFTYANVGAPVEIVSLRASAVGRLPAPHVEAAPVTGTGRAVGRRRVWFSGGWQEVPVWRRTDIASDTVVPGPAIIEEVYTTVLVAAGWTCRTASHGHLIATRA